MDKEGEKSETDDSRVCSFVTDLSGSRMMGFLQPNIPPPNSFHMFDEGKDQSQGNAQV